MHGMITLYLDGIIFRQQKSSKLHGVHVKVYATTITWWWIKGQWYVFDSIQCWSSDSFSV